MAAQTTQLVFFHDNAAFKERMESRSPSALSRYDEIIPFDSIFRDPIEKALRCVRGERKSNAGCKSWDVIIMFKVLLLAKLYNLSDTALEHQIWNRRDFREFLGLQEYDDAPDAKSIWRFRNDLTRAGVIKSLFMEFDRYLREQGFMYEPGQIIDSAIFEVPVQRNTREENEAIKRGEIPEGWEKRPAKLAQKDVDATWTKKHGKTFFGYKDHANVHAETKFIQNYEVTSASAHDSTVFAGILVVNDEHATRPGANGAVYADKAYRSEENEKAMQDRKLSSRVLYRAYRNKPLTWIQKALNRRRSRTRARVEHIFGAMQNDMGGRTIRSTTKERATSDIGLANLAYNMRRFGHLDRIRTLKAA